MQKFHKTNSGTLIVMRKSDKISSKQAKKGVSYEFSKMATNEIFDFTGG